VTQQWLLRLLHFGQCIYFLLIWLLLGFLVLLTFSTGSMCFKSR